MVFLKKYFFLLLIIFAVLLISTGCIKLQTKITLNNDGSGRWEYIIALSDELLAMDETIDDSFADIKKEVEESSFIINDYEEDGYTGVIIHKDFTNIEEINATNFLTNLAQEDESLSDEDFDSLFIPDIEVKKGVIYNTYKIFVEMESEVEDETDLLMFNQMYDLKFVFESPVEAKEHNAHTVSDDGKILTWKLMPGEDNTVDLEFKLLNIQNLLVLLLTILIVIAIVLLIILKRKNLSASEEIEDLADL